MGPAAVENLFFLHTDAIVMGVRTQGQIAFH